jgi:hypothetical protein
MRISRTDSFKKDFAQLPAPIQKHFDKKLGLFMQNIKHPSLRVRKYRDLKTDGKLALICSTASPLKFMRTIIFLDESAHMKLFLEVLN